MADGSIGSGEAKAILAGVLTGLSAWVPKIFEWLGKAQVLRRKARLETAQLSDGTLARLERENQRLTGENDELRREVDVAHDRIGELELAAYRAGRRPPPRQSGPVVAPSPLPPPTPLLPSDPPEEKP